MTYQYELKVTNNEKTEEKGYFYKAAPFKVKVDDTVVECEFKHGDSGKVIFEISIDGDVKQEITHPDYVPEISPGVYKKPEELDTIDQTVAAAFSILEISREATYNEFFQNNTFSFEVSQPVFMPE